MRDSGFLIRLLTTNMFEFLKRHLSGTANIISLIAVIMFVYSFSKIIFIDNKLSNTINEIGILNEGIDQKLKILEEEIGTARRENAFLINIMNEKNAGIEEALGEISNSVGTLEKLNGTDRELLQKYSKVYFLNEHFVPEDLTEIGGEYLSDAKKPIRIHSMVYPYLENMLEAAMDNDVEIKVLSGFRSFSEQSSLKSNYTITYGSGANQFSADQGYSEHQLGTTVDLTSTENGLTLNGFQSTKAYVWLIKNAANYGFTLSYPEGNSYYSYEPWHWRFVGKSLARRLMRDGIHFYDISQNDIDKYLINIFD